LYCMATLMPCIQLFVLHVVDFVKAFSNSAEFAHFRILCADAIKRNSPLGRGTTVLMYPFVARELRNRMEIYRPCSQLAGSFFAERG
jgi:hypothetical protein